MKIDKMRSDNGSNFRNSRIDDLCDNMGIKNAFFAKYTPKSNGLVERENRALIVWQGPYLVCK
jgi:transposase InsO family protein